MDENFSIPPVAEDPVTPLEFLETVYACNELPLQVRMRAAIAAAQFRHPKLAATTIAHIHGDLGDRLDRARRIKAELDQARAEGRPLEYVGMPKLIEGQATEIEEEAP